MWEAQAQIFSKVTKGKIDMPYRHPLPYVCAKNEPLRAADCLGYLVPVFFNLFFCNRIKPISAQELIGTSEIYGRTVCCLETNSPRIGSTIKDWFYIFPQCISSLSIFYMLKLSRTTWIFCTRTQNDKHTNKNQTNGTKQNKNRNLLQYL